MNSRKTYSLTDAMSYCLQQPGVTAASVVDIKTGILLSTQGKSALPTDNLFPYLTDWYLSTQGGYNAFCQQEHSRPDGEDNLSGEVKVTLGEHTHLIYPLSPNRKGLYIHLALNQGTHDLFCIRRCLSHINTRLHF